MSSLKYVPEFRPASYSVSFGLGPPPSPPTHLSVVKHALSWIPLNQSGNTKQQVLGVRWNKPDLIPNHINFMNDTPMVDKALQDAGLTISRALQTLPGQQQGHPMGGLPPARRAVLDDRQL